MSRSPSLLAAYGLAWLFGCACLLGLVAPAFALPPKGRPIRPPVVKPEPVAAPVEVAAGEVGGVAIFEYRNDVKQFVDLNERLSQALERRLGRP